MSQWQVSPSQTSRLLCGSSENERQVRSNSTISVASALTTNSRLLYGSSENNKLFSSIAASPRLAPSPKLFRKLIRAPHRHPRIDFPPTHHLSSRHPSRPSRSAFHDPVLQLGQLQPLRCPTMQDSICECKGETARGS